jgi:predicted nucleic acid-binding protein
LGSILLDTTVLIDVLRGRPAAARLRALRRSGDRPYTCAINVEELARGLRPEEGPALAHLLAGLRIAPLGRREGELAGSWRRTYASKGITLSQADCLIAAAAAGIGGWLATGNVKDFPMTELRLDEWAAGA